MFCVLHYATCIGLGYLAIFSNPAVQLFGCKYVTIRLSCCELYLCHDEVQQWQSDPVRLCITGE